MQSESTLISEYVNRLAVCVFLCSSIVFTLIEEGARLLTLKRVEVEPDAVHGEFRLRLLPEEQARLPRRQLLQLTDPRLHALDNCRRTNLFPYGREQCLTKPILIR